MKHKIHDSVLDKQIGANLMRLRKMRGFTRETLARSLLDPITQQAIDKYETGRSRIPASNLAELAKILCVPISELFTGVEQILGGGDITSCEIDARGAKMLKAYTALEGPDIQDAVLNMTRAIAISLGKHFTRV